MTTPFMVVAVVVLALLLLAGLALSIDHPRSGRVLLATCVVGTAGLILIVSGG